jgi:hypothetical protein
VGERWTALGLLGALLALGLALVHLPAMLWAGNASSFHFGFGTFLAPAAAALLGGLAAALLALRLLPQRGRAALACALGAVGILCWLYGGLFTSEMRVLDGQSAPMNFDTRLGIWELPLAAAACLLLALGMRRAPGVATAALLALNVAAGATSAFAVSTSYRTRATAPRAADPERVFRFSSRQNVLIVLLDGLQAGIVADVFERDPDLKAAFEGFRFFPDTLAIAPTTFLNLPAIHSGWVYRRWQLLSSYFTTSIERHSFVNRFDAAGYDTALVNPVEGVCPARAASCTSAAGLLRSFSAQLRVESLRLLELSMFRLSPVWLKQRIYDDGAWLFGEHDEAANEIAQLFEGNRLLHEVARRLVVDDGRPTLKFLHSMATHTPYVMSDDCRSVTRGSIHRVVGQSRCALLAVAALLERLKAAGVYDRTIVLVLADHGINAGVFAGGAARQEAGMLRAGAANPLFMLKRLGDRGTVREVGGAVQLTDTGATLCAASGACTVPFGLPAGEAPPDRPRLFYDYVWAHEFWNLRDIPSMAVFEVRGPVWDEGSWFEK